MRKASAYTNLAEWFEYLNDDCDYEQWSQSLTAKLAPFAPKAGLDIGCGAGWFTRAFQKQGYQMTGMDISPEMLDKAQANALTAGVRSEYILGDIAKTKLPARFDFATAINDCVNYIPKDKLQKAFKNVYGALKTGGVFLFDISSPRKFARKIANTVSVDDRDEVTYISFNKVEGERAIMDVTLFVKRTDGAFERLEETHTQYIYSIEEIKDALIACGFMLVEVQGHLGADVTEADRISFLAKKENGK